MKYWPLTLFFSTVMVFSSANSLADSPLLLNSPPPKMQPKPNFLSFQNVDKKKIAFVKFMKPSVLYMNAAMIKSRSRLSALSKASSFTQQDKDFLSNIATTFALPLPKGGADKEWFKQSLKRVDIIPVDLVLTQSAKESGWGTSRFAREGNNYYGQWCYSLDCGLIPQQRAAGATFDVAAFKTPFLSTQAYFVNLSINPAYEPFRDIRSQLRASNRPLSGRLLVNGLIDYSQLGQVYVNEVKSLMNYNQKYWDINVAY